jgi:uridine kinase
VKPEAEWSSHDQPSFPFDFIRYRAFMAAVQELAAEGGCSFRPWDWATFGVAHEPREVRADRPVVIEGVSALHPDLAPLYDLRIWVGSDAASILAASHARGVGRWAREWQELFLPSVELYLRTNPLERADIVARGRGK